MAVLINDFEVITEPPHAHGNLGSTQASDTAPVQAAPPVTPEVIQGVWRRELDRSARSYAG